MNTLAEARKVMSKLEVEKNRILKNLEMIATQMGNELSEVRERAAIQQSCRNFRCRNLVKPQRIGHDFGLLSVSRQSSAAA